MKITTKRNVSLDVILELFRYQMSQAYLSLGYVFFFFF